jgi:hypothetical protein
MRRTPRVADIRAPLHQNDRAHMPVLSLRHGNRRVWIPITSSPHDVYEVPPEKARPLRTTAATIAVIKWSGSLQNKDNPPRDRSQGLENRPFKGAISTPI